MYEQKNILALTENPQIRDYLFTLIRDTCVENCYDYKLKQTVDLMLPFEKIKAFNHEFIENVKNTPRGGAFKKIQEVIKAVESGNIEFMKNLINKSDSPSDRDHKPTGNGQNNNVSRGR